MPDSFAPVEIYDIYRETLAEHGHDPEAYAVCTNRIIYVCDDPEQGWEDVKEHYLYVYDRYREWFAAAGDFPDAGAPLADPDELSRELHVVGTPAQVVADIQALQRRFSFDRLIFWARPPGLPIEKSSRSLELFAQEVMPVFADASGRLRAESTERLRAGVGTPVAVATDPLALHGADAQSTGVGDAPRSAGREEEL
jgi:Luciferase-like monooxygenase